MGAIVQSFTVSAKPGRYDEARQRIIESSKYFRSRGAKVTVLRVIEGGPAGGGHGIITHEYESAAAWAAVIDGSDETLDAIRDSIRRDDGPLEIHATSLYQVADYPED
jgi:hypothetical protein